MPHHGNEEEHSSSRDQGSKRDEPVIRDNRKVDPVTGEARHPEGAHHGTGSGAAAAAEPTATPWPRLRKSSTALRFRPRNPWRRESERRREAAELKNDLLRLQAEYVNYRKRVERDRAVAGEMAVIGVLNSLLPVLDDVDAARQHGDLADGPFAAIATKLENALKTYGLTRIDETGVEFDPTIHEALIQQPGEDVEVDTVSQVLRSGYKSGERVLRAAQVIVAVPA